MSGAWRAGLWELLVTVFHFLLWLLRLLGGG